MNEDLLISVRLVCAAHEKSTTLPHVVQKIDAFRFQIGQWTLEKASKLGLVTKLDTLRRVEHIRLKYHAHPIRLREAYSRLSRMDTKSACCNGG